MPRKSLVSKYKVAEIFEGLTPKQQRFVIHYLENGGKPGDAAIEAGYSSGAIGPRLLNHPKVSAALGELGRRMVEKIFLSAEETMEQLAYLVTRDALDFVDPETGLIQTDVRKMNPRARACIDGFKQTTTYDHEGNPVVKLELKLSPKVTAVDMALKVFGKYAPTKVEEAAKSAGIDLSELWKQPARELPVQKRLTEEEQKTNKYLETTAVKTETVDNSSES